MSSLTGPSFFADKDSRTAALDRLRAGGSTNGGQGIQLAYEQAKQSGTYENVLLYTGQKVRHYALTDHKEYFAEGTEAYFYRNDFYPFVRAELNEHDPALHALLQEIWGR